MPFNIYRTMYRVFLCNLYNLRTYVWFQITDNNNPLKMINQFCLTQTGTINPGQSEPEMILMNVYFTFPKSLWLEFCHQMEFTFIHRTVVRGSHIPLQRGTRCILKPHTLWLMRYLKHLINLLLNIDYMNSLVPSIVKEF